MKQNPDWVVKGQKTPWKCTVESKNAPKCTEATKPKQIATTLRDLTKKLQKFLLTNDKIL